MPNYHNTLAVNNTGLPKFGYALVTEPELTRGGRMIKRHRPQWSASVCNLKAALAGIGQEVRHVG